MKKKYDLTGFFEFVFQIQVLLPCNGCPVLDPPNFGQVRVSPSRSSAFVGKNNMQLERQTMFLSIIQDIYFVRSTHSPKIHLNYSS